MVEEKRFGMGPGVVHCASDERRVDHRNATQDSGLSAHNMRLGCWRHGQAALRSLVVEAASRWPLMNASRSRFTMSGSVWQMPCGLPGYTLNVACLTSFAESGPESANGTIWSSSPCRMSTGTSIAFSSSVKSVSEKALMQSYCAFAPPIIPWRHQL